MEQKTEIPGIYKAEEGVLVNKDNLALQAYKNRKNRERRLLKVEEDLTSLKEDISELKDLLKGFLNR
jgi:hypothetical protein